MKSGSPIRLKITEDAVEELITTYARHTAMTAHHTLDSHKRRVEIVSDAASADRAACWLRMVSIVEIYTETLLKHLTGHVPDRAPGGWGEVINSLKRRHNVDVTRVTSWEKLDACFLVRNAIAHGLGRFTAKQLEKGAPRKLRIIGAPIRDGKVVITPASLDGCADVCLAFVAELDAHPQVTTA
jgi:hypothetical protein